MHVCIAVRSAGRSLSGRFPCSCITPFKWTTVVWGENVRQLQLFAYWPAVLCCRLPVAMAGHSRSAQSEYTIFAMVTNSANEQTTSQAIKVYAPLWTGNKKDLPKREHAERWMEAVMCLPSLLQSAANATNADATATASKAVAWPQCEAWTEMNKWRGGGKRLNAPHALCVCVCVCVLSRRATYGHTIQMNENVFAVRYIGAPTHRNAHLTLNLGF